MNNIFVKDAITAKEELESKKIALKILKNTVDHLDKKLLEYGEIEKGNLQARVGVVFSSRQIKLNLSLEGSVELACDRCLDTYIKELDVSYVLYGKFGHGTDQDDIDVFWIPEDKHYIDLVPVLFDYINLSLPIKKVHPDDKNGNTTCNIEMINKLHDMGVDFEEEFE